MKYSGALAVVLLLPLVTPSAHGQTRVHGIDVSSNQGNMNWAKAYDEKNVRFAFVRATRGPTTGTQSVNDVEFGDNVTALRSLAVNNNKVIYNGFYHYGRPDLIAINDGNNASAGGNGTNSQPNSGVIIASAQDEAQHFYNVVGTHYTRSGQDASRRLRPVLDVEERGGTTGQDAGADALTPANLSLWVDTFLNRFEQLSAGIRPLLYMNTNYAANFVTSSLADEDLWIANWEMSLYGDPLTGNGSPPTGVFGAGNWAFWQYDSPNGLGTAYGSQGPPTFSADMDLNAAHGDINFVRSFLIPEPGSATLVMGFALTYLATARRRRA